ncbi:MAG: nucleotide exchange factor GrpE [Desulforhopalus sp.]|nr:nucleotide exchange factor GrpE [Desulforhopalus sp.]
MSEEKVSEVLQDEPEVAVELENGSESSEEVIDAEGQGDEQERDIEKELADAQKEIADLRDRMLRAAAENENFKKRVERDRLASLKYAGETIFREILPVVDNLERAIDQGVVEGVDAEKNLVSLLEGVQLTLKSVVATLAKFEVKTIESVGKPFDPKHQEALTMAESDSVPANHVVTEFEKGYYYKDKLLRPAKVVVSSGKKDDESD